MEKIYADRAIGVVEGLVAKLGEANVNVVEVTQLLTTIEVVFEEDEDVF